MTGLVYLTKTTLEGLEEVRVDGRSALEADAALRAALAGRVGQEVASLFAEPVITRGNGAVPTSISWYSVFDGEPVRLESLDPQARAAPEARLRALLTEAARLLDDHEFGPLAGGFFQVASRDDIWVVDGRPVIANWGVLPADIRTPAARDEHFRRVLGGYLALARAPAITSRDWQERRGAAAAVQGSTAPAGAITPAAPIAGVAAGGTAPHPTTAAAAAARAIEPAVVLPPPANPPPRRTWLPPLIACCVLAAILLYLSLPGVLLYPAAPPPLPPPAPGDDIATHEAVNQALERRVAELRQVLTGNSCVAADQATADPAGGAGPSLVPPLPNQVEVPPNLAPAGTPPVANLVDLLRRATVLVLVPKGDDVSLGTGFVVAPGTIVTNRHVVEGGDPQKAYVTNTALGAVKPATVKATTPDSEIGHPDFAILDVPAAQSLPAFQLATTIDQLQSVVAAGYPGLIMETDSAFQQLVNDADPAAIPAMSTTQGFVTVIQNPTAAVPLIIHSAEISRGNSGGPLVDLCGRVVGINTFGRNDDTSRRLNFSLKADALAAFLRAQNVPVNVAADACVPRVAQAGPPSQGASGGPNGTGDTPIPAPPAAAAPAPAASPTGAAPAAAPPAAQAPPAAADGQQK